MKNPVRKVENFSKWHIGQLNKQDVKEAVHGWNFEVYGDIPSKGDIIEIVNGKESLKVKITNVNKANTGTYILINKDLDADIVI